MSGFYRLYFFLQLAIFFCSLILFSACSSSYPKGNLERSVKELFKKELDVEVRTKLVGKTLYVAFELENLVTKNLELPRETTEKLEGAMLSVSRIALSTDA